MDGDVQFEEDDTLNIPRPASKRRKRDTGLVTRLAIQWHLAKDEKEAQVVLLIAAVMILVFSVALYIFGNPSNYATPPSVEQIRSSESGTL